MTKQFYKPVLDDKGYYYHVNIYHEALLTFEQQQELEHKQKPCTSDPDDNTDWDAKEWCKNGSMSFAEKEWNALITRIRNHFKSKAPLLQMSGDWSKEYVYYTGNVFGLEGKFLKRDHLYIRHESSIVFEESKFMKDLTRIGRWQNARN